MPGEALERTAARRDGGGNEGGRLRGARRTGARQHQQGQHQRRAGPARGLRGALLAGILAGGTGCAVLSALGLAPGAPDAVRRSYTVANGFVHVEVSIPQSPPGRKPAIIGPLGLETPLLQRGFVVARFTNDWAAVAEAASDPKPEREPEPNRVGSWMLAAPRPGIVGRSYFALVHTTAETSVPAVVDLLLTLPDVDPDRIAVAGSSTQGFHALEALGDDPRLAAGVVRVACGDYHTFLRSSSLGVADDPRWLTDGELVLDPAYDADLRAHEAVRHADRYPPRPLLLLNGAQDPVIPLACAEHTADALRRAYREAGVPERVRFVVFDDAGHDLGPPADDVVLDWLDRWMRPGARPAVSRPAAP